MALLDLLGRRWALRVIWELREDGLSFRALRERCDGVSPTVLNKRLVELRGAGVLAQSEGDGYRLTRDGAGLLAALAPLDAWSKSWTPDG